MSYDIYLRAEKCQHCGARGPEPKSHGPTYNLTPIFDLALTGEKTSRPRGLRLLNGRKALDTKPWLGEGLDEAA